MKNVTNIKEVEVNGITYVEKGTQVAKPAADNFCIVRTYSAGVFAGNLVERDGKEGIVENAIRLYSWSGAATLSQMAEEGVKNPDSCKFAMPVSKVELTGIIEVCHCTDAAMANITGVKSWKV